MNSTLRALNGFGLGARVGERERVRDPRAWLTGWTISGFAAAGGRRTRALQNDTSGPIGFAFQPLLHEPGSKTVLGVRCDEAGVGERERDSRTLSAPVDRPLRGRRSSSGISSAMIRRPRPSIGSHAPSFWAPKGFGDTTQDWADPDSLLNRAELSRTIARR